MFEAISRWIGVLVERRRKKWRVELAEVNARIGSEMDLARRTGIVYPIVMSDLHGRKARLVALLSESETPKADV